MGDWVYTLLADGPTDERLMPIVDWTIRQHSREPVSGQFADHRAIGAHTRRLVDRIPAALSAFPCDMLIVHRDSEVSDHSVREGEVSRALDILNLPDPPVVLLIPVRMQEAWLLISESAMRSAAGYPSGTMALGLPTVSSLEGLADPKRRLEECLRVASGLSGRRLRRFSEGQAARRLSRVISDFTPLRHLAAFGRFEDSLKEALEGLGLADS